MPFLETIRTRRYPLLAGLPTEAWAKAGFKEVSPEPEWFDSGKKLIDENPEIMDWKEMKAIIKTALSDELGKELSTKREGQLRKYFEELHFKPEQFEELYIGLPSSPLSPYFNFWGFPQWEGTVKDTIAIKYAEPEVWTDEDWVKAREHFEQFLKRSEQLRKEDKEYQTFSYNIWRTRNDRWIKAWGIVRSAFTKKYGEIEREIFDPPLPRRGSYSAFDEIKMRFVSEKGRSKSIVAEETKITEEEKLQAAVQTRTKWIEEAGEKGLVRQEWVKKLTDEPTRIKDYKNFFGFKKIEDWPEVESRLNEWFGYWKGTTYTIPRHKTFLIPLYRIQERIIPEKSWLVKSISIPEKKAEFEQYINEINMSSWLEWRETESRREGPDWWRKYGKISNYLPDIAEYNSEIDRKFPETETERIMHEMFKLGPTLNKKMKDAVKKAAEDRIKLSLKLQPGVWQNTPPVDSAFLQSISQSHSVMLGMSGKLGHWAPYMGSIIQQALKQKIPEEVLLHPEGIKVIQGIAQDMAVAQERVNDARRDQAKKMKIAQIASVLAFIPAILAAPAVIAKGFSSVIKLITQPLTSLTNIFSKQKLTELVGKAGMNMITGGKISTKDLAKNLLIPVEIAEVIELGEGVVNLKGMYELTKKKKSTLLKRPLTEAEEKESEDEVDQAVSDSLAKEQVDRTEEMLAKEGIVPEVIVPEKIVEKVVIEKVIPKGIIPEITVPETILIKRDIIPEVVPGEVVPGKVPKYLLVGIPLLLLSGWAISRKKPKITYPLGV